MKTGDICALIESWAPPAIAWEKDNVGLLVGSQDARVRKVLVCLDVTPEVISEALRLRAGLIVSHHPLIFTPLRRLDPGTPQGGMIATLLRHGIGLCAAHTNLDFTAGGVSNVLSARLGLRNVRPLSALRGRERKIVVFVPASHAGGVMQAMAGAGAGMIGSYASCSFTSEGSGSFVAGQGSKPFLGTPGALERFSETRLEMVCPSWRVETVVAAMKAAHPYEEVAHDVYALENPSRDHGMGAIGELPSPLGLRPFLAAVSRKLGARALRHSGPAGRRIRRVAVCGGSGSELLGEALHAGADAFVTADVRYHAFGEAAGAIVLVDAGHFETERPAVGALASYLKSRPAVVHAGVSVVESKNSHNPVQYFR